MLKTVDPTDLPSTLRQVAGGTVFSTIGATESSTSSGAKAAGLTEREVAILTELASGKSNDEIAKELWVTQQTVRVPPDQRVPQARREEPRGRRAPGVPARADPAPWATSSAR